MGLRGLNPCETINERPRGLCLLLLLSLSVSLIRHKIRSLPLSLDNTKLYVLIEQFDKKIPTSSEQRARKTTLPGRHTTAGGKQVLKMLWARMPLACITILIQIHVSPYCLMLSSCACSDPSLWGAPCFSMECDLPHHLTACLHFAFLSYQRLRMPVCTINQWHFKCSPWPQLLCMLVQLAVLIMFMT